MRSRLCSATPDESACSCIRARDARLCCIKTPVFRFSVAQHQSQSISLPGKTGFGWFAGACSSSSFILPSGAGSCSGFLPVQGFSSFSFRQRWNTWRAPVGLQFSAAELRLFSAAVLAGIR